VGGRLIFAWTLYEAGKTIKSAADKGNVEYTRKIIFVETAKIEGALIGGAAGATAARTFFMIMGITPYGRAGQIVLTALGMGGAIGGSMIVDKALYQGMGLCR